MDFDRRFTFPVALACACLIWSGAVSAQEAPAKPEPVITNELDAFMAKVLARREVNRKTLEQYILDESESFEILGPGRMPLHRSKRDYTWYVRDGMHVRSPVRFNGVGVGEEARDRYEERWIRHERARQERKAKNEKETGEIAIGIRRACTSAGRWCPPSRVSCRKPTSWSSSSKPGNYYLAGREQLEGQEVLKVEYYPTRCSATTTTRREQEGCARKEPTKAREQRRDRDEKRGSRESRMEQDIERRMNKTALITLWIDPKEHQIVKYTFDNVWLDFLPAAWLVRVDDLRASMTMGQPFPGVWLPRGMDIHAGVTLANGSFEAGYEQNIRRLPAGRSLDEVPDPEAFRIEPIPLEPGFAAAGRFSCPADSGRDG